MDKQKQTKVVGQRIKTARELCGYTQAVFAEKIGYTQQYVSKCESGKQLPTLELLLAIKRELNVELSYFDPYKSNVKSLLPKLQEANA